MAMSSTWDVLLPNDIDSSGPESIADFAMCAGMDEYDSTEAALIEALKSGSIKGEA